MNIVHTTQYTIKISAPCRICKTMVQQDLLDCPGCGYPNQPTYIDASLLGPARYDVRYSE